MFKSSKLVKNFAVAALTLLVASSSFAQVPDAMGDGVCKIVTLLTGKWLFGFALLSTIGGGAAILFGAEITEGIKKLATIVTVVGLILGMTSLLGAAFSAFGAIQCGPV